ncbi:hypothetical protein JVU11DRAFT_10873 [Chiua virens]|nr:hypothetical protein JVU11DRAFT_10873 [Chiua virens]
MLYLDDVLYGNIMDTPQILPTFSGQSVGITAAPVFMRLREYHCMDVDPNQGVPSGGIQNAWFQASTRFQGATALGTRLIRNTLLGGLTYTMRASAVGANLGHDISRRWSAISRGAR